MTVAYLLIWSLSGQTEKRMENEVRVVGDNALHASFGVLKTAHARMITGDSK